MFANVKLKKVQTKVAEVDFRSVAQNEAKQKAELEEINRKVREADLENWYDALKQVTYPTEFVPITLEEGKALVCSSVQEVLVFLEFGPKPFH